MFEKEIKVNTGINLNEVLTITSDLLLFTANSYILASSLPKSDYNKGESVLSDFISKSGKFEKPIRIGLTALCIFGYGYIIARGAKHIGQMVVRTALNDRVFDINVTLADDFADTVSKNIIQNLNMSDILQKAAQKTNKTTNNTERKLEPEKVAETRANPNGKFNENEEVYA